MMFKESDGIFFKVITITKVMFTVVLRTQHRLIVLELTSSHQQNNVERTLAPTGKFHLRVCVDETNKVVTGYQKLLHVDDK